MALVSIYTRERGWRRGYALGSWLCSRGVALGYGEAWLHGRTRPVEGVVVSRGGELPLGGLASSSPGEWLLAAVAASRVVSLAVVWPYWVLQGRAFVVPALHWEEVRRLLLWGVASVVAWPLGAWLTLGVGVPGVLSFLLARQGGGGRHASPRQVSPGEVSTVGAVAGGGVVAFQPQLAPYLGWLWGVALSLRVGRRLPPLWYLLLCRRERPRSRRRRRGWLLAGVLSLALPLGEERWSPLRVWLPLSLALELSLLRECLRRGYRKVRAGEGST